MGELRLLFFCPYFPPHVGGLEGYASDLNDVLLDSGAVAAITVLAPALPPEGAAEERPRANYLVLRYPALELIPNFPVPKLWRRGFWRALSAARPADHDVFVSHTRFFLTSVFALAWARRCSRPLLHVEHGSDYVQLSGRAPRAAARAFDHSLGRLVLRHADGVVAISQAAADFVARLAGRRAKVIRRGLHTDRLQASVPDEGVLAWAGGRPLVAFVGRLIDGKGVADLLRAFATLAERSAVLSIVGDGPRRLELEALAEELGIAERVRFLGYLEEGRAWSVMSAADVVVNPSYTEGLPTSVLEAALLGRAVLATDVGGTSEILSDGSQGVLVRARDVEGLADGLRSLLGDPERRARLGRAARVSAEGRFDWNASAERFAALAGELVRAQDGRGPGGGASTSAKADS